MFKLTKLLGILFVFISTTLATPTLSTVISTDITETGKVQSTSSIDNGCITFTVGQGTGCEWMCNYCANQLGTNNYYFQDGVCTYQTGGCVGNPVAGKQYTCCSASTAYSSTDDSIEEDN